LHPVCSPRNDPLAGAAAATFSIASRLDAEICAMRQNWIAAVLINRCETRHSLPKYEAIMHT
jgi:hypothetical protein